MSNLSSTIRTILVGFDSFDPNIFNQLAGNGKLPNLAHFAEKGGYARLEFSSPPQTEVSWTSIASGTDPGGHGIFDFVHRNPTNYAPYVSLLPSKKGLFGDEFARPFNTKTIFDEAANQGYQATALWWPALFPANPASPVRTIPGLGTPDIRGQLGVGTFFTVDPQIKKRKNQVGLLVAQDGGRYIGEIPGPVLKNRSGVNTLKIPLIIDLLDHQSVRITIAGKSLELKKGNWSPILEIKFKAGPFFYIHAITRVILTELKPTLSLYFLPIQIHPMHPTWRYGNPPGFIKQSWNNGGSFLSLGWPQDTNGLEENCITDEQFLALCKSIDTEREVVLTAHLNQFKSGLLGIVFDSLDRVQHMFRRDRPDIVEQWYIHLDNMVGRIFSRLEKVGTGKAQFYVLSDHGFSDFRYKVNLNYWLIKNGYMALKNDDGAADFSNVNWKQTKAYAVGLNSLYLNIAGREGLGSVTADRIEPLLEKLMQELSHWYGPDDRVVMKRVIPKHEAFSGPLVRFGPDVVLGYSSGYRASSETGLGKWNDSYFEINHDHWGADHCVDASEVPGIIIGTRDLQNFPNPSYRDIPFLTIGKHLDQSHVKPPSISSGESQKELEERLKGLGYL